MGEMKFDFSGKEKEIGFLKSKVKPAKPHLYKYAVDCAKELTPAILRGERLMVLMSGRFILGDWIEAFAIENNFLIKELTISTLGINKDNVDSLHNLIAGDYCHKLNLVVSDYFYANNRGNIKYIKDRLDIDGIFDLTVASSHTKIILMEMENGQKISVHGSGNLKSSDSVEQMIIESDPEVYDFFYDFHDGMKKKYSVINKSLRGLKLWKVITDFMGEKRKS